MALLSVTQLMVPAAAAEIDSSASAERRGQLLWEKTFSIDGESRSCVDCHGNDPTSGGKHVRTGKPIEPMAFAANPTRFSDPAKTEKWFRRNCRWTMGRLCSENEKQDIISYLKNPPGGK